MKPKTILTVVLVVFLCATTAYLIVNELRSYFTACEQKSNQSPETGSTTSGLPAQNLTPAVSEESVVSTDKTTQVEPAQAGSGKAADPQSLDSKSSGVQRTGSQAAGLGSADPQSVDQQSVNSKSSGLQSASQRSVATKSSELQQTTVTSAQKVLAYYFHGTQRCPTCMKLEAYSAEAIEKGFGEALKQGSLEWRVVNVDEPLNKHFVKDYQLYTKSVIIAKIQNGKQVEWKNLEKVWELVGEKDDFVKYVQDEVSAYLGERK